MGDVADAITIFVIVVINGILGFVQEFKTEKSLDALKSLAAPTCKVLRDGNIKVINANELTIGDVVILEAGDRVPADGEIFECTNFMIDESLLTGESVGVNKTNNSKEASLIYMGTKVLKGKGRFRVTAIGMSTKMGSIADMLQDIEEE
ncbi:HAD-IC family P-type ATPase, partial [Clostridium perfringens]